jgi:hypothetical protein
MAQKRAHDALGAAACERVNQEQDTRLGAFVRHRRNPESRALLRACIGDSGLHRDLDLAWVVLDDDEEAAPTPQESASGPLVAACRARATISRTDLAERLNF